MRRILNDGTMYEDNQPPIIVCVGSDLAIGDCLGPITGSMLKYKTQGLKTFLYGTLASPVTAKEVPYMRTFLKETHAGSQVIAVDAAVGQEGDIHLRQVNPHALGIECKGITLPCIKQNFMVIGFDI